MDRNKTCDNLMKPLLDLSGRLQALQTANTACTRPPTNYAGVVMVGRFAVRVFRQFLWLEVGSVKMALSRPTHQYPEGA